MSRVTSGKVVLVRSTDGLKIEDQVAAAAAGKAALVMVLATTPGVFQPFTDPNLAVPTVALSQAEGNDLRSDDRQQRTGDLGVQVPGAAK